MQTLAPDPKSTLYADTIKPTTDGKFSAKVGSKNAIFTTQAEARAWVDCQPNPADPAMRLDILDGARPFDISRQMKQSLLELWKLIECRLKQEGDIPLGVVQDREALVLSKDNYTADYCSGRFVDPRDGEVYRVTIARLPNNCHVNRSEEAA